MDLAELRRNYSRSGLLEADAAADPIEQFRLWMQQAIAAGVEEPNAMSLATVGASGAPSVRLVLLKGLEDRGFLFYTNYESAKARDIDATGRVALAFYWQELERQVRVAGTAKRVAREESEQYFRSRPRGSQLGAWASAQSRVIAGREELERSMVEVERRFGDRPIPLPPAWGGYVVQPLEIEFWQGRPDRLHDRLLYSREARGWRRVRLAP